MRPSSDLEIEAVRAVPIVSGFFFDDQRAIKAGAEADGATYRGEPATDGFERIREAGEALTVELALSDGTIAAGDCAAVQYSGAGGRDPLFRAERYRPIVENRVGDALTGRDPADFETLADEIEELPGERRASKAPARPAAPRSDTACPRRCSMPQQQPARRRGRT